MSAPLGVKFDLRSADTEAIGSIGPISMSRITYGTLDEVLLLAFGIMGGDLIEDEMSNDRASEARYQQAMSSTR